MKPSLSFRKSILAALAGFFGFVFSYSFVPLRVLCVLHAYHLALDVHVLLALFFACLAFSFPVFFSFIFFLIQGFDFGFTCLFCIVFYITAGSFLLGLFFRLFLD